MIGGNIEAVIQQKNEVTSNAIGEKIHSWSDIHRLWGWLDLSGGDSKYSYNAKLQESTHIFITDYISIDRKTADKRLVVNGGIYDILYIDDPMEMHQHLEITLKYVGVV